MRIQTATAPLATRTTPASSQPRQAAGSTRPVDSFEPGKVDRSAAAAMARLEKSSGSISGVEMRRAILEGIKDLDGQGASSELSTIQSWGAGHQGRLTKDASEVLAAYAKIGAAANQDGQPGLNSKQLSQLKSAMSEAAKSDPGSPVPTAPVAPRPDPATPPPANGRLAYALAHPNEFFKRQAYSAKYNPRPDELKNGTVKFAATNGNCGPTSLAMAVKAFGLEQPRVAGNPEDSIDLARNAMTLKEGWDTLREPANNHVGTNTSQMLRGAQRLGLEATPLPINKRDPLEALDEAFSKGRMVLLGGQPGQPGAGYTDYEQAMRSRSGKTDYAYDGLHYILVMGKDSAGRYLVADPLSRKGVVAVTAKEMASYEPAFGTQVSR